VPGPGVPCPGWQLAAQEAGQGWARGPGRNAPAPAPAPGTTRAPLRARRSGREKGRGKQETGAPAGAAPAGPSVRRRKHTLLVSSQTRSIPANLFACQPLRQRLKNGAVWSPQSPAHHHAILSEGSVLGATARGLDDKLISTRQTCNLVINVCVPFCNTLCFTKRQAHQASRKHSAPIIGIAMLVRRTARLFHVDHLARLLAGARNVHQAGGLADKMEAPGAAAAEGDPSAQPEVGAPAVGSEGSPCGCGLKPV